MTAPLAVRGYSQLQRSTIRCEAQSGLVRSSAWGVLGFWDWLLAHVIQCNSRQPHLILILQTPGSFCHGARPATRQFCRFVNADNSYPRYVMSMELS